MPTPTCCSSSPRRARASGLPIFMLTLQHLSFEDYLAGTDGPRRREWAKVQGRFEDIAYVESARQTRALIGTVFDVTGDEAEGPDRSLGAVPGQERCDRSASPIVAEPGGGGLVLSHCTPHWPRRASRSSAAAMDNTNARCSRF